MYASPVSEGNHSIQFFSTEERVERGFIVSSVRWG